MPERSCDSTDFVVGGQFAHVGCLLLPTVDGIRVKQRLSYDGGVGGGGGDKLRRMRGKRCNGH